MITRGERVRYYLAIVGWSSAGARDVSRRDAGVVRGTGLPRPRAASGLRVRARELRRRGDGVLQVGAACRSVRSRSDGAAAVSELSDAGQAASAPNSRFGAGLRQRLCKPQLCILVSYAASRDRRIGGLFLGALTWRGPV